MLLYYITNSVFKIYRRKYRLSHCHRAKDTPSYLILTWSIDWAGPVRRHLNRHLFSKCPSVIYYPTWFLPQFGLHQHLKQDLGFPIFHLQAWNIQFGPLCNAWVFPYDWYSRNNNLYRMSQEIETVIFGKNIGLTQLELLEIVVGKSNTNSCEMFYFI